MAAVSPIVSSVVEVLVKTSAPSGSMARTRLPRLFAAVDDEGLDAVRFERRENGADALLAGEAGRTPCWAPAASW